MSLTASGPAAAYVGPQVQQDGSYLLVVTAAPPSLTADTVYQLTLTETQSGYSNSPHATTIPITFKAAAVQGPIMGTITAHPSRVVKLDRLAVSPPTWPALFDPSDSAPYVFDLSTFLEGAPLDTIVAASVSAAGVALGVQIDTGTRGAVVDQADKLIAIWPKIDPAFQSSSSFANPVTIAITIRFVTAASGGTVETYERSALLTVKQL